MKNLIGKKQLEVVDSAEIDDRSQTVPFEKAEKSRLENGDDDKKGKEYQCRSEQECEK